MQSRVLQESAQTLIKRNNLVQSVVQRELLGMLASVEEGLHLNLKRIIAVDELG